MSQNAAQVSPFGASEANGSPHLTTVELAARWRCTVFTLSGKYQKLGLRPFRLGKRLLFPMNQVLDVEKRLMAGEVVARGRAE
jgi:hypothetical protein